MLLSPPFFSARHLEALWELCYEFPWIGFGHLFPLGVGRGGRNGRGVGMPRWCALNV